MFFKRLINIVPGPALAQETLCCTLFGPLPFSWHTCQPYGSQWSTLPAKPCPAPELRGPSATTHAPASFPHPPHERREFHTEAPSYKNNKLISSPACWLHSPTPCPSTLPISPLWVPAQRALGKPEEPASSTKAPCSPMRQTLRCTQVRVGGDFWLR